MQVFRVQQVGNKDLDKQGLTTRLCLGINVSRVVYFLGTVGLLFSSRGGVLGGIGCSSIVKSITSTVRSIIEGIRFARVVSYAMKVSTINVGSVEVLGTHCFAGCCLTSV